MRLTVPELNLLSKVYSEQQREANENQIYLHHLQGHLNAYAFNAPNDYPKIESLLSRKKRCPIKIPEKKEMTTAEVRRDLLLLKP